MLHPCWSVDQDGSYIHSWGFEKAVYFSFVHINPEIDEIDLDEDDKNLQFQVWVEAGPPWKSKDDNSGPVHIGTHDVRLDCGADTADEALLKLAGLVDCYYSDISGRDAEVLERLGEL